MRTLSLRANPIMGLTGSRAGATSLVERHDDVYFSDLRELVIAGKRLSGKLFYGCRLSNATFAGAVLHDVQLSCCVGPDPANAPLDQSVQRALQRTLREDWDGVFDLLRSPISIHPQDVEIVTAIAAGAIVDPRPENRVAAINLIGNLLAEHSDLLPRPALEALNAFVLYGVADELPQVYQETLWYSRRIKPSAEVLHHLVTQRASFADPHERAAAVLSSARLELAAPDPPAAKLLDDEDPDVLLALFTFFLHRHWSGFDLEKLMPGDEIERKLDRLIRFHDERVRSEAIRFAGKAGGTGTRDALVAALANSNELVRRDAFQALYYSLFQETLRPVLLGMELLPEQRAFVREKETEARERARLRDEEPTSAIAEPDELRAMLASAATDERRDALRLIDLTADEEFAQDVRARLNDPDPQVRAIAERVLKELVPAPPVRGE